MFERLVAEPRIDDEMAVRVARHLLSAQLTLGFNDWTLEGYATNLADKEYISGQSGNNEFYGAPREYGVRASVRF